MGLYQVIAETERPGSIIQLLNWRMGTLATSEQLESIDQNYDRVFTNVSFTLAKTETGSGSVSVFLTLGYADSSALTQTLASRIFQDNTRSVGAYPTAGDGAVQPNETTEGFYDTVGTGGFSYRHFVPDFLVPLGWKLKFILSSGLASQAGPVTLRATVHLLKSPFNSQGLTPGSSLVSP